MTSANLISVFYLNELISCELMKEGESAFLPSHAKFREDFFQYKKEYNKKFAQIIFDYLVFASLVELTNTYRQCEVHPERILGTSIEFLTYEQIENEIHNLDLDSYFKMAETIFNQCEWTDMFGGEAWGEAIEIAQWIGKIDNTRFCDTVIDLEHNTGCILDKKNPYFDCSINIESIIQKKASSLSTDDMFAYLWKYVDIADWKVMNIFRRFFILYLKEETKCHSYLKIWQERFRRSMNTIERSCFTSEIFNYMPVRYKGIYAQYNIVLSEEYIYY